MLNGEVRRNEKMNGIELRIDSKLSEVQFQFLVSKIGGYVDIIDKNGNKLKGMKYLKCNPGVRKGFFYAPYSEELYSFIEEKILKVKKPEVKKAQPKKEQPKKEVTESALMKMTKKELCAMLLAK